MQAETNYHTHVKLHCIIKVCLNKRQFKGSKNTIHVEYKINHLPGDLPERTLDRILT